MIIIKNQMRSTGMRGFVEYPARRALAGELRSRCIGNVQVYSIRCSKPFRRVHEPDVQQCDQEVRHLDLRSIGEHSPQRGKNLQGQAIDPGRTIRGDSRFSFVFPVQWGLTCDTNRWKLTLVGTINNVGQFVGLIFAGYVSDR